MVLLRDMGLVSRTIDQSAGVSRDRKGCLYTASARFTKSGILRTGKDRCQCEQGS